MNNDAQQVDQGSFRTIGILGGMGPLATVDLFNKIVRWTDAGTDQAHLPILINNVPQIPDRTAAICGNGPDPTPAMLAGIRTLANAGADFLLVPCNSAHVFLNRIKDEMPLPLLSLIDTAADHLVETGVRRAAILATRGALQGGIYQNALSARGILPIVPDDRQQGIIMDVSYRAVKAGAGDFDAGPFRRMVRDLVAAGADALILGCTELPVAVSAAQLAGPFVDPTELLAKAAIIEAGGTLRAGVD